MATKSELLELARILERYKEPVHGSIRVRTEDVDIIIDALRTAASVQQAP